MTEAAAQAGDRAGINLREVDLGMVVTSGCRKNYPKPRGLRELKTFISTRDLGAA